MRRALSSLRMPWFGIVISVVSLAIRALAAIGQPAQRYPDSVGYDSFSFLSQTNRPWPIPFIYSLAGTDTSRVVVQVVLGTLAWASLAWVLSRTNKWQRASFIATIALGLSPQIIRYDVAILSESLSISLAVFAIAATLYRSARRSALATAWWSISLTLCVLSRPAHVLIPAICVLPVVWQFLASRGKTLTATGVGFIALFMVGVFTIQQSQPMSLLNLYTVISSRVITDDQRFDWFVKQGMPNVAGMRQANGYDYVEQLPPDVANIVKLPVGQQPPTLMRVGGAELATWLTDNGWKTVAKHLVFHPGDTFRHAQLLASPTLNAPNGDFLPLQNGPMIPWAIFGTWQLWMLIFIACSGILFAKTSGRQQAVMLLSMCATAALIYLATVHTSGIEHVRHVAPYAAILRILGLSALLMALPKRSFNKTLETADE